MFAQMLRWTLGSIVVATCTLPPTALAATCSRFDLCPSDNNYIQMRQPYSSYDWTMFHRPTGTSVRIAFTDDEYKRIVGDAFYAFASLDNAMPYDYAVWIEDGGDANIQWGWVDQATLRTDPDAETFVPAAMGRNQTDCFETTLIGKFAYNPGEGVEPMQWVPDYCYPPCTMNGYAADHQIDFKAIAMHEYGHALGLDDVDDWESTMYGSGAPTGGWQDRAGFTTS